jgi:2-C-methyl-D-erythritol 4-phosphate cytidylyltransferase/2-C-methyl-D-erythritol 2,4-cyclodiphosphate synthase
MSAISAIIVAAGSGQRFGSDLPKQYQPLNGKPVLAHSLAAFEQHPQIERIVVTYHPDHWEYLEPVLQDFPKATAVKGGATRQESVSLALESLAGTERGKEAEPAPGSSPGQAPATWSGVPSERQNVAHGAQSNKVLIHDAARPNLSQQLISKMIENPSPAAVPVTPVTDTIKHQNGHTLDRSELFAAQTPQAFDFETILRLHREAKTEVTDDAMLAEEAGINVALIEGEVQNRKITTKDDLMQMSDAKDEFSIRVGNGYDVHGFIPHEGDNKTIMICGIAIPCKMAIEGHSDGDVGLHALTDAILGAIGDGDIGEHFSSDNPQWKGADSELFLKEAIRRMQEAGGKLGHCDITLIAQMPKLSPHRQMMRQRVAEICGVSIHQVSVKATTTDHLGFIGRKEGLAAMATATVMVQEAWEASK